MNSASSCLPEDHARACLIGRVWAPDRAGGGPVPVAVRGADLIDLSGLAPTVSMLLEIPHVAEVVRSHHGDVVCRLEDAVSGAANRSGVRLLAPCDLQAVKAAGVTFADSMIERVIEERAKGDPLLAAELRTQLVERIGAQLKDIIPGSDAAARAKAALQEAGLWSQYLEVGIGPDAEIFTKAQPMAAVGHQSQVGIHPGSVWNNPEPEVVLAVTSSGAIVGATLGNDVNLRDFEGRSALLLSKAKDNNASCAIGPFIRLFDHAFTLDDVRTADIRLEVHGPDSFVMSGLSSMSRISRDPADLAGQALNRTHQYPDGMMLFLGTLFSPTQDRGEAGKGFTHRPDDVVTISSPRFGVLRNTVTTSDLAPEWTFGVSALIRHLCPAVSSNPSVD